MNKTFLKYFYLLTVSLFFCACGNSGGKTESTSDPAGNISEESGDKPVNKITPWFKKTGELPFCADTALFSKINSFDSLGTTEVKLLTALRFEIKDGNEIDYDLKEFYKIDSIKASGTYLKWCETLDIGMTKQANAFAISKTQLNENTLLLIWALSNSSYEACPYFSGVKVYFNVIKNNEVGPYFLLGEFLSAGDPPVALQRTLTGNIDKEGKVVQNMYEESDQDMDQPLISVTKEYYEYLIKDGKIEFVKEKKEKPVDIKRPKQN